MHVIKKNEPAVAGCPKIDENLPLSDEICAMLVFSEFSNPPITYL
jgi:hypothetical protein